MTADAITTTHRENNRLLFKIRKIIHDPHDKISPARSDHCLGLVSCLLSKVSGWVKLKNLIGCQHAIPKLMTAKSPIADNSLFIRTKSFARGTNDPMLLNRT